MAGLRSVVQGPLSMREVARVRGCPAAVANGTRSFAARTVVVPRQSKGPSARPSPWAGVLPDKVAQNLAERVGVDRMAALRECFATVRRAGTVSIIGVYGGQRGPFPMMDLFDKGVTLRMGQAHVKRWIGEILPVVTGDDDPLGTEDLTTHRLPLEQAPHGYDVFQKKKDGCIKVVLKP